MKLKMKDIFITADLHMGHNNLITRGVRSQFKDCEEHDQTIITNWNNRIPKSGITYIIGDVVWNQDFSILDNLNGQKIIIKGNHDKKDDLNRAKSQGYICNWHYQKGMMVEGVYFYFQHFAPRVWDRSYHGSICGWGHSHGNLNNYAKSMDVSVDRNNFIPITLEELYEKTKDRGFDEYWI